MATIPNRNDVLLGKGRIINGHPGNRHFRSLVDANKETVAMLPKFAKKKKRLIAVDIVNKIQNMQPPGRFLVEDPSCASRQETRGGDGSCAATVNGCDGCGVHPSLLQKAWICVDTKRAISKVIHRLREKHSAEPEQAKTSSEDSDLKKQPSSTSTSTNVSASNNGKATDDQMTFLQARYGARDDCSQPKGTEEPSDLDKVVGSFDSFSSLSSFGADAGHDATAELAGSEHDEWDAFLQELSDDGNSGGATSPQAGVFDGLFAQSVDTLDLAAMNSDAGGASLLGMAANQVGNGVQANGLRNELDSNTLQHFGKIDVFRDAPNVAQEQSYELTVREWIKRSFAAIPSPMSVAEHAKSALPIAFLLTSFLVEAGRSDKNDVPLSSIHARNVSIRMKHCRNAGKGLVDDGNNISGGKDDIECVHIRSNVDDHPRVGNVTSRLCAMGFLLFELFTADQSFLPDEMPAFNEDPTLNSVHLNDDFSGEGQRPQKSQRQLISHPDDRIACCMAIMEVKGVPRSLRELVKQLLDCSRGDFRGDDSYSSFADLQNDLRLMIEHPFRFVDDFPTDPMPVLELCDKCYGREEEILKLNQAHEKHTNKECGGAIISGGAGIGKTHFVWGCLKDIASRSNSYLFRAKFDQNKTQLNPLSTIWNIFNSIFETIVQDASQAELIAISSELESALGSQAGALVSLVPGLARLLPPSVRAESFCHCIDSGLSMRFLLSEALGVIVSHSRPILLIFDDIQWADDASLLLVGNLLYGVAAKPVFFALCVRNEAESSASLSAWLSSLAMFHLESIDVKELSVESVNNLISYSLHLPPRLTRSLASAMHRKSAGNPLFLRQLISSLSEQRYIYLSLNPVRWMWDLTKIQNMEMPDDVVALLVNEMQKLDSIMRVALTAASCIGSCVSYTVVDVLANDLKMNLMHVLTQLSIKGYMIHEVEGALFRFSHDKIQESAYQLISEEERRKSHMRYGLALSSNCCVENDDMLFTVVNQINLGGPKVLSDAKQKRVLASLNLKAGRRANDLSDYASAFGFFRHGIMFISDEHHWQTDYKLSLNLFDAAAEAACDIGKINAVASYSDEVLANAKSLGDKLACLQSTVKALRKDGLLQRCIDSTFEILVSMGEDLPSNYDAKLGDRMKSIDNILHISDDERILGIQESTKKVNVLQNVYSNLTYPLLYTNPSLLSSVSLRMVELTIFKGLSSASPMGFVYYGQMMMAMGRLKDGCRLGRLSLKLCEIKNCSQHKSGVIFFVSQFISWAAISFQSIVDAHSLGRKCGRQSGDFFSADVNWGMCINTNYIAGSKLHIVREELKTYILYYQGKKEPAPLANFQIFYIHLTVLVEGVHVASQSCVDGFPGEQELLSMPEHRHMKMLHLVAQIYGLVWAVLFQEPNRMSRCASVTDVIAKHKHSLRILCLIGIFYEGLASFQLARQTSETMKKMEWFKRGEAALALLTTWSEHSTWNWENKKLLLEAESMQVSGNLDRAGTLYIDAIRSAREHKFIQEEAISSELAGMFYYRRGIRQKSLLLLSHSVTCYSKWGAAAVAKRVESLIACMFGTVGNSTVLGQGDDGLEFIFGSGTGDSSKKRQNTG